MLRHDPVQGGEGVIQFLVYVWDGGIFHCTNSGKRLKYTCWKGVDKLLFLESEYHK